MNLGFEVVAARSKKTDANDDLAFEPMRQRARKEPRKQPSTDEKKVKRRLTKSALAWSRRDSLDHDTEFVRYVLLSDTEALEASVIRDETTDEPTWAWLVSVIDRQDGGILEFVMSGSASGLDEAKGKADVALDRAEMDMMFERVGSRKQAASDHQETIWYLTGYLMGYNGDAQPDDNAPFSVMTGYSAGSDDLADNKPANYTRSDLDYFTETEDITSDDVADFFEKRGSHKEASMPIMVPSIEDLPADREDMAWYEVYSQRRSSGQLVLELEWSGHDGAQAKRVADFFIATDSDVMFVQLTRNAGRETYGVQMTASRKQASENWYVFDGYPDDTGQAERPLAGPFVSVEEASAVLKDVAYPFQFPYGPETVVGDLFIATELNQMYPEDFINQTIINHMLSSKQSGYHYQPDTQSSFDVEQYDESPGEPFTNPSGHTYSGPEPAEATGESYVGSRSSSMQREADILEAMRFASLTEQRQLMAELNTIRANRTAARQADRDIDLTAAVIEDRLTPVLTKSMHTVATDWLTEVPTPAGDGDGTAREMVAQASVWFKRLSSEVVADRDEFAEQARGKARQLTSSLGEGREAAIASFLDAAAHLRAKKSAGTSLEASLKTATLPAGTMYDDLHDAYFQIEHSPDYPSEYHDRGYNLLIRDILDKDERGEYMEGGEYIWDNDPGGEYDLRAREILRTLIDRQASKTANELMGYGEGEYVTNAGDDMMMDDMSGMDMDPRYETNASRKHAEWDQSAFDAWMKQVDSKMVGMSGLGASDLPDQPYADWFEDGMSASEAAQLSLSDTADEMGFGGLFGSRKQAVYHEMYGEVSKAQLAAYRKFNVSPSDHDDLVDEFGEANHDDITRAVNARSTNGMYESPFGLFSFDSNDWNRFNGSRKQAMPSDDLIDVDIEDYMGGDEGPDPDSQSGHAETALPYAGDDTTPAFRETGWTAQSRRVVGMDREDVDTEDMLRFLQEEPQYLPEIAGMTWHGMRDWYARKYDYFADVWGLAIDPDTIDWEFISENMPKTGKRKRRATRKTASGYYDHAGGVVSFGDWSHDEQVGDSYGRVFVKQNEDGTYDVFEVIYYASVNALGGNDYEEELANDEVFVVEVTNEYRGLESPDDVSMSSGPEFSEYRNDLLARNVSAAEAERLAEQYASNLSARGDHIASRKTASAGIIQHYVVYGDGYISDPYNHVNGGPEPVMYEDVIANLGGDAQRAAEQYGRSWWIETRVTVDGDEISEESPWDAPDTEAVMTGLGVTAKRRKRGSRR